MGSRLEAKTIVVGMSGGIACYKAAELVRLLTAAAARVRVIMTAHAMEFITPMSMQTLSGQPVSTDTFSLTQESEIGHIRLADTADAIAIAPATANLIAKLACGLADDLLSTVLLATRAPVLIAPSMNVHMYENAVVQQNLGRLRERGLRVIEPASGFLACGYEGVGRLAEPASIVAEIERALTPQDLNGERVLVTAGPTREPIDPVRFVSNRSSGKMGYALAAAAWRRGAEVVLVSGPAGLEPPRGVRVVPVRTAAEMREAVLADLEASTIVLMAAAVADYRPSAPAAQKIKKGPDQMRIDCERTPDILRELARRKGSRFVVGFAAETEKVLEHAERKLKEKNLDLIAVNDVSRADAGFEVDTNAMSLLDASGVEEVPLGSKAEVAERILDRLLLLKGRREAASRSFRIAAAKSAPAGKRRRRA